jgi:hypothetical protein
MEWLSQLDRRGGRRRLVAVAASRGFIGGCGHDMAHEGPHEAPKAESADAPQSAVKKAGDPEAAGAASSHPHRGGCCS